MISTSFHSNNTRKNIYIISASFIGNNFNLHGLNILLKHFKAILKNAIQRTFLSNDQFEFWTDSLKQTVWKNDFM